MGFPVLRIACHSTGYATLTVTALISLVKRVQFPGEFYSKSPASSSCFRWKTNHSQPFPGFSTLKNPSFPIPAIPSADAAEGRFRPVGLRLSSCRHAGAGTPSARALVAPWWGPGILQRWVETALTDTTHMAWNICYTPNSYIYTYIYICIIYIYIYICILYNIYICIYI